MPVASATVVPRWTLRVPALRVATLAAMTAQRAAEGGPENALVVERNVLEWRFDPASDARLPVADYDLQVIVLCQEGYTSSLAAAALLDLGLHRATDLDGGFAAWLAAGLPTVAPGGDHFG